MGRVMNGRVERWIGEVRDVAEQQGPALHIASPLEVCITTLEVCLGIWDPATRRRDFQVDEHVS